MPRPMLTDSGIETVLIHDEGLYLPEFAAFVLLAQEAGRAALARYYRQHLEIAAQYGTGFVLETPTWRASRNWGDLLGYPAPRLAEANRAAVELVREVGAGYLSTVDSMLVSGCVGPALDGYDPDTRLTVEEAVAYHRPQATTLAEAGVDRLCAMTLAYAEEAIGLTRVAAEVGTPVVISFTVETDGRLPSGMTLREAVRTVDEQTGAGPAHYMINCAHPSHFAGAVEAGAVEAGALDAGALDAGGLDAGAGWRRRIRAVRANASTRSHAEMDAAEDLDTGDPEDLGRRYADLSRHLDLAVLGGCCGTDARHVAAIAAACLPPPR